MSVALRRRYDRTTWLFVYVGYLFTTLVIAVLAYVSAPTAFPLALVLLLVGCGVMIARPVVGLQLMVFLALVGDSVTVGSWPFTKNMSSKESVLFVSPQLSLSPVELWLLAGLAGWVLHMATTRRWRLVRGRLFLPVMMFAMFVVSGLLYGVARGGDTKIALVEARAMLYLPPLYVLAMNTFTKRSQYRRLVTFAVAGIGVNALLSIRFFVNASPALRADPDALIDHTTALVMNIVFVLLLSLRLMHGGTWRRRLALLLVAVPVAVAFLQVKRRASIVCLVAAGLLLFLVLFFTNRRRFRRLFPVVLLVAIGYLGVFWNSSGVLGFPAQAMKTVIAPEQLSERDVNSNFYRDLETADIKFTIRSNPITGIGFGHAFYRPFALPAIASFELSPYITHNSMLWIWMKTGVAGFIAFLFLFASALHEGARAVLRELRGDFAAVTVTCVAYVLMYGIYTHVDIAWDVKSMILLGFCFAQIDAAAVVEDDMTPTQPRDSTSTSTVPVAGAARQ